MVVSTAGVIFKPLCNTIVAKHRTLIFTRVCRVAVAVVVVIVVVIIVFVGLPVVVVLVAVPVALMVTAMVLVPGNSIDIIALSLTFLSVHPVLKWLHHPL